MARPHPAEFAYEMRRTAKALRSAGFDEEVCNGNERIAEYIEEMERRLAAAEAVCKAAEKPYDDTPLEAALRTWRGLKEEAGEE